MEEEENEGVISVREFLGNWDASALSMCNAATEVSEEGQQRFRAISLSLPADTVEELSKVCEVDLLWCGDEPIDRKLLQNNIPENTGLQTLDYQKMAVRKKAENRGKPAPRKLNAKRVDSYMLPPPMHEAADNNQVPLEYRVSCDDVVLVVHVFKMMGRIPNHRVVRDQTYLVRGCMPLTSLRDAIKCVNDYAVAGDVSHNPKDNTQLSARDICKSAMFFIHKTFYNDMREYDNLDYSKEIREWLVSQGGEELPAVDMANTCFQDLQLQLGTHYLYQHQGDCEHMIVFSDLRLIHPTDPQDSRHYPFLLQRAAPKRVVCRACSTHTASYQVFDSDYAPENPCFMCQDCFLAFHYDEEDKKIGAFKAYKHVDASML